MSGVEKTAAIASRTNRGPIAKKIRCTTTGEIGTIREFSEAIAKAVGTRTENVTASIFKSLRTGSVAYGLRFERIGDNQ